MIQIFWKDMCLSASASFGICFQSDAQRKRDQLTNYFSRFKDSLDRKEQEMRTELDTREKRVLEECKRKIDSFQNSEKDINSAAQKIKQLLTEERLQLLNVNLFLFFMRFLSILLRFFHNLF